MNFKPIEEFITQFPIYQYTFLKTEDVEFNDKVRAICKKECPRYGKSWSCPPAVGSVDKCREICRKYPYVLLFSSVAEVPDYSDFDALLKLPGVGRKSANLIMGDVFGKPAIVTDTHCIRLVNRMGLVDQIKEPKKVEMALWKLIPPEEGSDFCHRLVFHGREVCTARTKPYCEKCCLKDICAKIGV